MSVPKIKYCLVCEDARRERGNKTTILGFYGITPDVEIGVADVTKPVDRLMFFLVGESARGPAVHSASMQIHDDREVGMTGAVQMNLELPDQVEGLSIFAVGLIGLVFGKPGTFTFRLTIDGREHFTTRFRVTIATPAQLAI